MIKEIREIEIEAFGRVQGVMFRNLIKSFASNHKIKGFAENRNDGSVRIIAQGDKKDLDGFLAWIETNPGMTKINGLNYKWREISKEAKEFKVLTDKPFILDKANSLLNFGKSFFNQKMKIPVHIAIIPDGNRRWARQRGFDPSYGHYKSGEAEGIRELANEARKIGIKYITIWGFSTENWKRDRDEIKAVFDVVEKAVDSFIDDAKKEKIRFRHIGRRDRLPKELLNKLDKLEKETKNYNEFNVQLCLDYGGKDEIVRAVNKLLKERKKKVDEEEFYKSLDFSGIPELDLIIRTGGEKRLSGLMPYQSSYAELYFTDVYFPDFNAKELRKAVEEYGKRQRRFGGG